MMYDEAPGLNAGPANAALPAMRQRLLTAFRFSLLGVAAAIATSVIYAQSGLFRTSVDIFLPLLPGAFLGLFLAGGFLFSGLTTGKHTVVFVIVAALLGWSALAAAGSLDILTPVSSDNHKLLIAPVKIIAVGSGWSLCLAVAAGIFFPALKKLVFFLPNVAVTAITSYPAYVISTRIASTTEGWMGDFAAPAVLFVILFAPWAAITGFALPNPSLPEIPAD